MDRRNWLQLARKLVDRFDMDYTVGALQGALGEASLSFFGEGVLDTTLYPNPFPITMSGVALGGTVGNGIAYDPEGQISKITPESPAGTPGAFTIPAANPSNPRWDLLVLRYKATGETAIPKPSDPISTTFLNLIDDYELAVVVGTPAPSPVYPAKGALDIILAGLQVPAAATLGTSVNVDLTKREQAKPFAANAAIFVSEIPTGAVDGVNDEFTLSQTPQTSSSVIMYIDGMYCQPSEYSIAGDVVTFFSPPSLGQSVEAWYIADSPMSQNPLSGVNQTLGTGDGATTMFTLPGTPPSKDAIQIFLDGLLVDPTLYTFSAGDPNSTINFITAPALGQEVGSFYLVNSSTVSSGPTGVQTVSNVGTGAGHVAQGISGTQLKLKTIKAGANVTVSETATEISVSATGGGGGGAGFVVSGSVGAPDVITAVGGISPTTDQRQAKFIKSNGGPVTVTATPQIAAGVVIGQELVLFGTDDTDYVILADGNGLGLNGSVTLKQGSSIYLLWTGSLWWELSRR